MKKLIYLIIIIQLSPLCFAGYSELPLNSKQIAIANNFSIAQETVDIYFDFYREKDETLSKAKLLSSIINNHLIAEYVIDSVGIKKLDEEIRVGFSEEVMQRDLLLTMVDAYYSGQVEKYLKASGVTSLDNYIVNSTVNRLEEIRRVLDKKTSSFVKTYVLNQEQIEISKDVPLLMVRFPKTKELVISLWDIYQEGNIQDKLAIFNLEENEINKLIERKLRSMFIEYWVERESTVSKSIIDQLKSIIRSNDLVGKYYVYTGYKTGIHDDNYGLKRTMGEVSDKEINEYYWHNKELFITKHRVQVRHITLDTQAKADEVSRRLKQGEAFGEAVMKYSTNVDKNNNVPGDLGWISKDYEDLWLASIAFSQPYGQPSAAFLSPRNNGLKPRWEIVLVDDIEMGYYHPQSETVRYKASREIAKNKIAVHHQNLIKNVIDKNDVLIDKLYLDEVKNLDFKEIKLFDVANIHEHKHN